MKTDKFDVIAYTGDKSLKLATVYSKGLAYIVAEKMVDVYALTADRITVQKSGSGFIEYSMFTGKAKA